MKNIERYGTTMKLAACVAAGCFSLIVLAAFGVVGDLHGAGFSLWPVVMVALIASIFVACWASAKSKGRSGWLGIALPFLDILGLKMLHGLDEKPRENAK